MSHDSSLDTEQVNDHAEDAVKQRHDRHWWMLIMVPILVVVSFFVAQFILVGVIELLVASGVQFTGINSAVLNSAIAACVYVLTLLLVVITPWLLLKSKTSRKDLGVDQPLTWRGVGLVLPGFVGYILLSVALLTVAVYVIPGIDIEQEQDVGFNTLYFRYEYLLAFITLVIIAPLAEEILFRGYLYGKLRKTLPLWVSILITSLTFGIVHMAWNVGIDTFALSIVLCILREMTGSIWSSVLLHMLKNGIAFFLVFIYPILSVTLGA